jgi:hypothetical protein
MKTKKAKTVRQLTVSEALLLPFQSTYILALVVLLKCAKFTQKVGKKIK